MPLGSVIRRAGDFYQTYGSGGNRGAGGDVPLIAADFEVDEDLTIYNGSPTGTLANGATVHDGYLDQDLAYAQQSYCRWGAVNNWTQTNQGAVRVLIRPNYSGSPVSHIQDFFYVGTTSGNRFILIQHATSGTLLFQLYDAAAGLNIQISGSWSPTSGQTYEIELNWDINFGATRAFIDGTQFGTTKTTTGTINAMSGTDIIAIGRGYWTFSHNSNFSCFDFKGWGKPQHTEDY